MVSRLKQPKSGLQNCLSFYFDQTKFLLLCRHKMWKSLWISYLLHFFSFILVCSYVACCLPFVPILVLLLTVASLYLISWTAQRIATLVRSHVKVKSRKDNLFRIHCHICKILQAALGTRWTQFSYQLWWPNLVSDYFFQKNQKILKTANVFTFRDQ